MTQPLTAVVLDALAAPLDPGLEGLLGAAGAEAVRRLVRDGARAFCERVAPGRVTEAATAEEVAGDGPVLLVAPDVPHLTEDLARDGLADLEDGAALSLGVAFDEHLYAAVLPRAAPELLELFALPREEIFARSVALGGGVGMLRTERRLATAADARAIAADPLAPPELARLLRG